MSERRRLDFRIRVLDVAEDDHFKIELLPHPDRYDEVVIDGAPCLLANRPNPLALWAGGSSADRRYRAVDPSR